MYDNFLYSLSEIDDIFECAMKFIQNDKENFKDITFIPLQGDNTFSSFQTADMLYMKIHYIGTDIKQKWLFKNFYAKEKNYFHIVYQFNKDVCFCCLIQFNETDNIFVLKNALDKIPLFNQKAIFSRYKIFIPI